MHKAKHLYILLFTYVLLNPGVLVVLIHWQICNMIFEIATSPEIPKNNICWGKSWKYYFTGYSQADQLITEGRKVLHYGLVCARPFLITTIWRIQYLILKGGEDIGRNIIWWTQKIMQTVFVKGLLNKQKTESTLTGGAPLPFLLCPHIICLGEVNEKVFLYLSPRKSDLQAE